MEVASQSDVGGPSLLRLSFSVFFKFEIRESCDILSIGEWMHSAIYHTY